MKATKKSIRDSGREAWEMELERHRNLLSQFKKLAVAGDEPAIRYLPSAYALFDNLRGQYDCQYATVTRSIVKDGNLPFGLADGGVLFLDLTSGAVCVRKAAKKKAPASGKTKTNSGKGKSKEFPIIGGKPVSIGLGTGRINPNGPLGRKNWP